MAIKNFKGDIERNLQEQVAENYRLILEHYNTDRILEDYGIKVIGEATAENLLPDPLTYTGTYGDAYAVGVTPPYSFYVFTRPFDGEADPHWFNLGKLAIQGPAGENGKSAYQLAQEAGFEGTEEQWLASIKGETGETGERGSKIFVVDRPINTTVGYLPGDVYIILSDDSLLNGTVATLVNGAWETKGNITGPTGLQGNPGENGTPGDAVNIIGILTSEAQLPAADSVARNSAYVIQDETGQWLYFITGTTTVIWSKVPFENGTTVTVGGNPVQVFDADTKVNKRTTTGGTFAYTYTDAGDGAMRIDDGSMAAGAIPKYFVKTSASADTPSTIGGILVSSEPTKPRHVATKNYVDTKTNQRIPMPTNPTTYDKVPALKMVDGAPQTRLLYIDNVVAKETINGNQSGSVLATYRNATPGTELLGYTKVLISGEPVAPSHVATKNYVDTNTGWIHITFVNAGDTYTLEDGVPFELRTEGINLVNINMDDASIVAVNTMNFFGSNLTTTICGGQYTGIRSNTLASFDKKPVSIQSALAKTGVYLRYIRTGVEVTAE